MSIKLKLWKSLPYNSVDACVQISSKMKGALAIVKLCGSENILIFQVGSHEAATRKLKKKYQKGLCFIWEGVEGFRSTGGILLSPPSGRLASRQQEEN